MTQDPTRADFEEWYKVRYHYYCPLKRDSSNVDDYSTDHASISWVVWQAATKHQSDKCAGLVMALEKCEKRFLEYAASHRLKGTADGVEKAGRNHDMAVMCKEALKEHRDSVEGG